MPPITSANVTDAIVKTVAAELLPNLVGNLVLGNLVNRSFEPRVQSVGDTVNIPIRPNLVANNINEGSSIVNQNPEFGNAALVLDQHIETSFEITDIAQVLSQPDLFDELTQPAVIAMAESIEASILQLFPFFTQNPPIGTGGTNLNEATVDLAETTLFNAKVPQALQKYLITDGNNYSALRQIPRFSEMDKIGPAAVAAIVNGQVPELKDTIVLRSQFVPKTGSGPATTHNLCFTRPAIAMAMRRLPEPLPGTGAVATYAELGNFGMRVMMSYNHSTFSSQFSVDALYGVTVADSRFGIEVRS